MSRQYIQFMNDLIQTTATREAASTKITLDYIEGLFDEIAKKMRLMEEQVWDVAPVDDNSLRSFFDVAKNQYLSTNPIKIEASSSLTRANLATWLSDERHDAISWNYLHRFLDMLKQNGRAEKVIHETKQTSREIVSKLGDPKADKSFFVKGLVVGEVQSGKTENFNAVINRAIDCGYQLVIVFSGTMEDLRRQTQDRLESDVIGLGSLSNGNQGIKGVGRIVSFGMQGNEDPQIETITSCDTDFHAGLANSGPSLTSPKILVCKKNVTVLVNLLKWLAASKPEGLDRHQIPLLVLDDEADNASLNNEGADGREYASKINGHIRALLEMFEKKSYVGYTASPFANVLQDRNEAGDHRWPVTYDGGKREFAQVDNLFPDDFIFLLEAPTNYVGAKQIFETIAPTPKLPVVTAVTDHTNEFPRRLDKETQTPVEDYPTQDDWDAAVGRSGQHLSYSTFSEYRKSTRAAKRDDTYPSALPQSLRDAILCFILGIAVRESRKSAQSGSALFEPHNTMLVHVSLFTTWQNKTAELIADHLTDIKRRVQNDQIDEEGSIFHEFEVTWNRYFRDIVYNIKDYLQDGYEDPFMIPIAFAGVRELLPTAIRGIEVLAINSETGDKLTYEKANPKKIIAVGGNRLSRGFTLKGLTINYFVRSTNYSDTLLQMGRWFGYRPGYLDCCRIFATPSSIEKFNSTTRCIEDLEREFKEMHEQNKSPGNFLLKVRKHAGVLEITRPSILKNTKTVNWSFEDKLEMTTKIDVSKQKITDVWESFKKNTAPLFGSWKTNRNDFLTTKLEGNEFVEFLKRPNNFEPTRLGALVRFIEDCQKQHKLINWTVALKLTGNSNRKLSTDTSGLPCESGLAIRRGPDRMRQEARREFLEKQIFRASGDSANIVSSPKDLAITISDEDIEAAENNYINQKLNALMYKYRISREEAGEKLPKTIPEKVYRERIPETDGILIIYLFDSWHSFNQVNNPDPDFKKLIEESGHDLNIPLVGYAIGIPPIENAPGGVYAIGDYDTADDAGGDEEASIEDKSVPDDGGLDY
jgi:Z1 domain